MSSAATPVEALLQTQLQQAEEVKQRCHEIRAQLSDIAEEVVDLMAPVADNSFFFGCIANGLKGIKPITSLQEIEGIEYTEPMALEGATDYELSQALEGK